MNTASIHAGIRNFDDERCTRFRDRVHTSKDLLRIRHLLEATPDEDSVERPRPEVAALEAFSHDVIAALASECRGISADVDSDGVPSPSSSHLEKAADVAPDLEHAAGARKQLA